MRKAGFATMRLGLETVEFDHRQAFDKKVSEEEFKQAAGHLKEAGFERHQVGAYLLAGLPGQDLASIEHSIHTASRYDLESDPVFTNNAILPCTQKPFAWDTLSRLKELAAA